jgi:hypothetical protein
MATTHDPFVRTPISRANLYPRGPLDTPPVELAVTHLVVQINVSREGMVTIEAVKDAPDSEADYLEIDLDPPSAGQLAAEILAAVTQVTAQQP